MEGARHPAGAFRCCRGAFWCLGALLRACRLLICRALLTAASPAFTARSAVLTSRSGRGSCISRCQSRSASALMRMAFNPSRISTGPRPSARSRWYVGRLMLFRKQNSGTVYATRSSEGKSLRASPSNLLVTPTQRLLFRGRQPTKSKWEPPGGAGTTLRQRKTPTVQFPAYGRWKPPFALCTADLPWWSDNGLLGREQRSRRTQ